MCGKKIKKVSSHMDYHKIDRVDWHKFIVRLDPVKKEFTCEMCDYKTDNKSNFNKHRKSQHNPKQILLSCEVCKKEFGSKTGLDAHMVSKHSTVRYQCDEDKCVSNFTQIKSFRKHMIKKHQGVFTSKFTSTAHKCLGCQKYFSYPKEDHECNNVNRHKFRIVKGFQLFPASLEEINKRKTDITEVKSANSRMEKLVQELIEPVIQDDLDIQIKVELEEEEEQASKRWRMGIEDNSTRSKAGARIALPILKNNCSNK